MKAFYFILGHYVERNLQYGLVHTDLTPRPAYVAFAAVGRLLNAAKPIGRVDLGDEKLKGFVFSTRVDGADRETLVAWSETDEKSVSIKAADSTYDYLGREMPQKKKVKLTRAPVFFVLPPGGSKQLKVTQPPANAEWRDGKACPVVLQLLGTTDFKQSAFIIGGAKDLKLVAYNFGKSEATGKLIVEGGTARSSRIHIAPGGREEQTITTDNAEKVTVRLDLGGAGTPVVSALGDNSAGNASEIK